MPLSGLLTAVSFSTASSLSVVGGAEAILPSGLSIAHARADAGAILGLEGGHVRWRAPPVCAPARVTLIVQAASGTEEGILLRVAPSVASSGVAIVPGESVDEWELHASSDSEIAFTVHPGTVRALPSSGRCRRAVWSLPEATQPDLALAAAFGDGRLVGWSTLPRASPGELRIQSKPGTEVAVFVAGRRFGAVADQSRFARVLIEVPPGVERVEIQGQGDRITHDLTPPPVTTERVVAAPDGALWLFRTDEKGSPRDETAPNGVVRVEPGVYRLRGTYAGFAPSPIGLGLGARAPSPQPKGDWRAGVVTVVGPSRRPGGGLVVGRSIGRIDALEWRAGGTLLGNGSQQRFVDNGTLIQRSIAALALWGEAYAPLVSEPVRLGLALGVGAVGASRRVALEGQRTTARYAAGPWLSPCLQMGMGGLDAQIGAFWSTAELLLESSRWGAIAGLTWRWGP